MCRCGSKHRKRVRDGPTTGFNGLIPSGCWRAEGEQPQHIDFSDLTKFGHSLSLSVGAKLCDRGNGRRCEGPSLGLAAEAVLTIKWYAAFVHLILVLRSEGVSSRANRMHELCRLMEAIAAPASICVALNQ